MSRYDPYCMSSFLTLRYVTPLGRQWAPGLVPLVPQDAAVDQVPVRDPSQVLSELRRIISKDAAEPDTGILLSSGIDSAILAALLPRGRRAYGIRFDAEGALDETGGARRFAEACGLDFECVTVNWDDHLAHMDGLMRHKRSPLHPVEVGLFCAAQRARRDGLNRLIVGNGADSTFGGLDKLLSRDWTPAQFKARYTFVDPEPVLVRAFAIDEPFERYATAGQMDVVGFLKDVHGLGIVQAFENALQAAGISTVAPYEQLCLAAPLDLQRIRKGESKYILRDVFKQLYPGHSLPEKIPFARPLDRWMASWPRPSRPELRRDTDLGGLTGEQRWLVFCLERFMNIMEGEHG